MLSFCLVIEKIKFWIQGLVERKKIYKLNGCWIELMFYYNLCQLLYYKNKRVFFQLEATHPQGDEKEVYGP